MIESYAIDLLKSENIRDLPNMYASLTQASKLSLPKRDNQKEIMEYLKGLTDFHVKLVASTRNPWIINFYDSIVTSLARFQYFCIWIQGLTLDSQSSHEQIYNLLTAGSYEKAKKLLMSHINYTVEFIEDYIRKEGTGELQKKALREGQ
jgi:DNA-binding GntR family transcriptional regulator